MRRLKNVVYRYKYRVKDTAVLGEKPLTFKGGTAVAKRLASTVENISLQIENSAITIVADQTPPITRAQPATTLLNNSNYLTGIGLNETDSNEYDDLQTVYYTTDGSTPNMGSNSIVGKIPTLPNNTSANLEGSTFTLKYFGIDNSGNKEAIKSEFYTVDTIDPIISDILLAVTHAKAGTKIDIVF